MRILITGGRGQLAGDLGRVLEGQEIYAPDRSQLDITSPHWVDSVLESWRPDVLINTAAFHKVDLCEEEPEQSFLVNAAAPQRLAACCKRRSILLIHLSTDYVFDGASHTPYTEDDPIGPLSVYGASKAAGELAIRATTDRHIIVRTTGLYGVGGIATEHGNFVETMLRLATTGEPISVVADQVLTPSSTVDVASAIASLIERGAEGTFHVTNSGSCSWYEFARELFSLAGLEVSLLPCSQAERPLPARRPAYSVLGHDRLRRAGLAEMPSWQAALARHLAYRSARIQQPQAG